jgi:hypothetical protein
MTTFREAVDAGDLDAVEAMLAEEVVFHSPVAFRPYRGRAITSAILRAVTEVFDDFRYVREIPGERDHVLVFEATVDGLAITGCDILRFDEAGRIDDFVVMVRPLRAAQALADRMSARFARIRSDAAVRSPE